MEELDQALKITLRALKRKDLFEAEIRALLSKNGLEIHADDVTQTLREKLNWSDEKVTKAYLERSKTKGAERISAELEQRGAVVDIAFKDEPARARLLLADKFGETYNPAKAFRFLRGRGFSEETCEEVVQSRD